MLDLWELLYFLMVAVEERTKRISSVVFGLLSDLQLQGFAVTSSFGIDFRVYAHFLYSQGLWHRD